MGEGKEDPEFKGERDSTPPGREEGDQGTLGPDPRDESAFESKARTWSLLDRKRGVSRWPNPEEAGRT